MSSLKLTSQAFADGGFIPERFTCEGENVSPPLTIEAVPEAADSLALIVVDPDIPEEVKKKMEIDVFDHWIVFDIGVGISKIAAGESVGTSGGNSSGSSGYTGPCPPANLEPTEHRYVFSLYALDTQLGLSTGADKATVENSLAGHVLATDELVGRYEKTSV